MADQTNPWGSAPSTDSAAQAADAWGGASTAAPANGGGADWLHSAPAPQPEQFNIMDPFQQIDQLTAAGIISSLLIFF